MSQANRNSSSGLISVPGFLGPISRIETERLLKGHPPGVFLIRESLHFPGDFTLSISSEDTIEHYRIMVINNTNTANANKKTLTIDEEVYFSDLFELVEHYTNDADGLCSKLSSPLLRAGKPEDDKNFDMYTNGWVIKKEHLTVQDLIGKGEFSEVFKADYKGTEVAVKVIKNKGLISLIIEEASMMARLNHPNLVHLKGVVLDDGFMSIVTEFMSRGSLVEYLRTRGRSVITGHDQVKFASRFIFYPKSRYAEDLLAAFSYDSYRDVCSGMAYLEERKLVHRDLAARNVLINESGTAKVSDFGLALASDSEKTSGSKIPVKWTAPEALKNHKFSCKSDVWSFGILLWEIYSFGRVPYPRIPLCEVISRLEENYRMDPPEGCPPQIHQIMKQTWSWKPEDRPMFKDVLSKLVEMCSTTV